MSDGSERRALARELHTALLAEFGARAIYHRLARTVRDRDLAHLLAGFESDEEQQIAELRQLMLALGLRPAARSRRRWLLAEALAAVSVVVGRGSALRVCLEAEQQRARWYAHILEFLVLRGERRFDDVLQRMTTLKQVHAQSLGAWVSTTRWR